MQYVLAVDRAEHFASALRGYFTSAIGNGLVEQAQRVAQAAVCSPSKHIERGRFGGNVFFLADELEPIPYQPRRQPRQVELQAARQHGDRQFLRIGGCKQELDVRRRFFKRFQQRIERVLGQHVHFVDQVHLEPPAGGCELNVVQQIAGIVDLGLGCSVHLDQVDKTTFVDLAARAAFATGICCHATLTVQRFRQNARDRGLADPAGTCEQVRMV